MACYLEPLGLAPPGRASRKASEASRAQISESSGMKYLPRVLQYPKAQNSPKALCNMVFKYYESLEP